MLRVDEDGDTARLQRLLNAVGDLRGQRLLRLQALRETVENARQLRNADDAPVGHVGDMRHAQNGHHVMLAMAFHADRAQHHHVVIALDLLEGAGEHGGGVLVIAGAEFFPGAHNTARRADQPFARDILADPAKDGLDGGFRLVSGRAGTGVCFAGRLGAAVVIGCHDIIP